MKNRILKKTIAGVLAFVMMAGGMTMGMYAQDGETYYGAEETVKVISGESARETDFNKDWKFYLGTSGTAQNRYFDDSNWEKISLPHDFSIKQSFTTSGEAESGFLPGGTGWYRKSFVLPEGDMGKTVFLNFDGVYSHAYVYVNGTYVGEHHYGYTGFAFDITDYITIDGQTENVIAVRAVNNIPSSRWYSGSGIYRDVTLLVTDPIHVDLNGTYVTTPNIANGDGTVDVTVDVKNDGTSAASVTVTNTVYKKGTDSPIASDSASVNVAAGAVASVGNADPVVSSPALWSIETPNLYTVRTILSVNGEEVDRYDTDFGFRYFSFDSSGFHLNGKNVKINGVCMHHDQGALGSAAYYDAMYRQLSIMKEMGCNAIRTSHNPADEQFVEICSELGFVVFDEVFDGLVDPKNSNSNDFSVYFEQAIGSGNNIYGGSSQMTWSEYALRSVVRRDRNEPSVIAWSLGNEIQEGTDWANVSRYDDIIAGLIECIKEEDTTRPATSGDNNRGGNSDLVNVINTITNSGGIAGFNYANSASALYSLAQNYGGSKKMIVASETSSATNSRGVYTGQNSNSDIDGKYHLTSYDTSSVTWGITAHDSIYNTYQYDCVAGEFVWTGFDYIGEPTPWNGTTSGSSRGAIPNSSYFGIVETTGFEKDTYYLYRSQWNKEKTTLHLVTAWDSDNYMLTSNRTPVWVYSNAPVVKLYRNNTLVGTATRGERTSDAGHTYYTYTTQSDSNYICTTSSGSGADALYAIFNLRYAQGTIRAEAYEADGVTPIQLDENSGKYTVTTPGTASKLIAASNKTEIAADGSSLVYIEVDVTDASNNPDTTAANNIVFTLTGPGEIVGVDNGDQATTDKYQQSTVLTSTTSANIDAYAGKALVIVRSTETAGDITVTASATGLSSSSVTVRSVADDKEYEKSGLVSYTMVRDYTVLEGTNPKLLTTATTELSDGTTAEGTIVWENPDETVYGTAGDYTISGILTVAGEEPVAVTAKLHVIADVIALRNVSTVTTPNVLPTLTDVVSGVLADGTLSGEFAVTWDPMTADQFSTVGNIVTIHGTATIVGDMTLPVTCTVRVAEAVNTESVNVAPQASSLTQDIEASKQSDRLESIINNNLKPGDNTNERWSNWGNRTTSANAALTFKWDTAQVLSGVNLYYYYDNTSKYPESIEFLYSLDGVNFQTIEATAAQEESYNLGAHYSYTFDQVINPVAVQIKFTQQGGTSGSGCVALTEAQIMTFAGLLEFNSSADLSGIAVDGSSVPKFAADTYQYEALGDVVTATTASNAGITILPEYEGVVRILTISEDGSETHTYEVTVGEVCEHADTELREKKDVTCTADGYTGDKYCNDCGVLVTAGDVIKAMGHVYDAGVKEGIVTTYTCTKCGYSYSETTLEIPSVSASVTVSEENRIIAAGSVEDFANRDTYYEIKEHGIVYMMKARLGSRNLTIDTPGRTKVKFMEYDSEGGFSYSFKVSDADTWYTVRSYLTYVDKKGIEHRVYSDPVVVTYNSIK